jgi:hypothetical protein
MPGHAHAHTAGHIAAAQVAAAAAAASAAAADRAVNPQNYPPAQLPKVTHGNPVAGKIRTTTAAPMSASTMHAVQAQFAAGLGHQYTLAAMSPVTIAVPPAPTSQVPPMPPYGHRKLFFPLTISTRFA